MTEPPGTAFDICPDGDCQQIAEVVDDYVLDSTDGPVRHVVTYCLARHSRTTVEASPI